MPSTPSFSPSAGDAGRPPTPGAVRSPPAEPDDLDLVEAARRGSSTAFDGLVLRHQARVLRVCGRILSDADAALDAAQEVFVRAWRGVAAFAGDAKFSTWLTRIAINQCRNELRRRRTVKHQPLLSLDLPQGDAADGASTLGAAVAARGPSPIEAARGREVAEALSVALADLDDEAREVVLLRDAEQLSYDDIATILDVPVGTVRSRLHRARADLHRRLAPVLGATRTASEAERAVGRAEGAR